MKISIILASLIALAPLSASIANAETSIAPAYSNQEMIDATWALANVTDDALDLASEFSRDHGIQATAAGSYINDLIGDTNALKHAVQRLADKLTNHAPRHEIQNELNTIETKYQAVNRNSTKVSTQLYSQLKTLEGYQLRTAFTKIRSRYVYLQAQLAE